MERLAPGMNYVHASQILPLGPIDIQITHLHWYGIYNGIEEAYVKFNPDTYSLDEVAFHFDGTEDDTGRSDLGAFEDFRPAIKMNTDEENNYLEELHAQGFYDYDIGAILESVFQTVVFGERSTYWEDVARPTLRIDELAVFNRAWFRELLSSRDIDPDLFEVIARDLPIRESIGIVKQAERLRRFDAMRFVSRKGTTILRDILSPREKAVSSLPDDETEEVVYNETEVHAPDQDY